MITKKNIILSSVMLCATAMSAFGQFDATEITDAATTATTLFNSLIVISVSALVAGIVIKIARKGVK